jgi:DNA-directed RNA polymerase specialized sigma24 family protein
MYVNLMNKKNFWLDNIFSARVSRLDAEAFADLYRTHTYAVFNYCLFRVGDRTVAEDLTADTF